MENLLIKEGKTNLKYVLIVVILATIIGGGILAYQFWWLPKQEIKLPEEVKPLEQVKPAEIPIVVGLDEYHVGRIPVWEKGTTVLRATPLETGQFLEYLNKNEIKTVIIHSKFTAENLENLDVLIMACPTQPISISEKEELKKFLDQGKGLLLTASHLQKGEEERIFVLNDLAELFGLPIRFSTRFCTFDDFSNIWTKEITDHPVTLGIDAVLRQCGNLSLITEVPEIESFISLVEQNGEPIYGVQNYSNGRIGTIASCEVFTNQVFDQCNQCQELNLNLIKWLSGKK